MILVSSGQSLLDICLQELGDVGALFDLADANGLAITDCPTPGQSVVVPASVLGRPEVVSYFASRTWRVNTRSCAQRYRSQPDQALAYFHKQFFNPEYFK